MSDQPPPDASSPTPGAPGAGDPAPGANQPAEPSGAAQSGDPTAPRPPADQPGDPTAPQPPGATGPAAQPTQPWDPAAPQPAGAQQPQPWDPAAPPPTGAQQPSAWDPAAPQAWPGGVTPYGPQGWPPAAGGPGWPTPPTGGFPTGGYGVPGYPQPALGQPGWYPPGYGFDPTDPLVTPPGAGVSGWFDRCVGAIRRGWRLLLPILLLTQVLPAAALSVISLAVDPTAGWDATAGQDPAALPDTFLTDLAIMLGVLIGGSLLFGLVQSVGWAAGSWVVARQAAGEPVGLGAALRYGLRRALGLWGWTLLIGLIVALGTCLCVIPGIYFAFALSMAGPVWLFERQAPIGRAWRMFHDRLGLLLGRVAMVVAAVIVGSMVAGVVEAVGTLPFGLTPLDSAGSAVGVTMVILAAAVLALPAHVVQLVGLVVTYAEQRAHEGPVNAARLAGELG
ncbi:hypothetical protein DLJ47_26800 [Micromonospora sp. S4605]|uniref:hypothetical protein n=1 Tax=Micromonospora sp. S4605 TaxID=1420897 RepID=UPI000D6F5371|nr:hypothetical protein [Micromonospora sp. S4605]PWU49219.1 hypothetical protein DLJ47_26800 [Micromonospora sp. S4605]